MCSMLQSGRRLYDFYHFVWGLFRYTDASTNLQIGALPIDRRIPRVELGLADPVFSPDTPTSISANNSMVLEADRFL